MVLTREEKERLVLDLYNLRTPIRDIAREAGMSFRDIGRIIDKKEKEKESREGQVQQMYLSTHAYKLFSEGKTPEEVAIALNLRQAQVIEFYTEHWKLNGLYILNQIYEVNGSVETINTMMRLVNLCML
jgi:DNA-binding Lrp family transcriptional regulator